MTYDRPGITARLLLLGVLVFGQCCLMAAHAFAMGADGHGHMAPGAMDGAVAALHADPHADACCIDAPALLAQGVTPDKPLAALASAPVAAPPVALAPQGEVPQRGPPPRPFATRRHVLLQTFLI